MIRVAIVNHHGFPLTAEPDGAVYWNREEIGEWEGHEMIPLGSGRFAFKSCHGRYLSAQPDGRLEYNRDALDIWETFHIESADGHVHFRTHHEHFQCVTPDGDCEARGAAAEWETFKIQVALINHHGFPLTAEPDGAVSWSRGEVREWESHSLIPLTRDGHYAFKSHHGRYLSAQPDGRLEYNRDALDIWESFAIELQPSGAMHLRTHHGHYQCITPDGDCEARGAAAEWETFTSRTGYC